MAGVISNANVSVHRRMKAERDAHEAPYDLVGVVAEARVWQKEYVWTGNSIDTK